MNDRWQLRVVDGRRLHVTDLTGCAAIGRQATLAPGIAPLPGLRATFGSAEGNAMEASQLMAWIQAFLGLLQSAAGSEDFYVKAAHALVDLMRLDFGRVLFRSKSQWEEKGKHLSPQKKAQAPISVLEAMLVEVLASGVAAGLARLEQERAALRTRLQMEHFFTPRLAAKLEDHPELLVGREANVSLLFCDIRGFSRITQKLGPAKTLDWMSDVMGVLTQCVLDREGVVVDYIGDEVMAMWGAPEDQPDHAMRACRAALAMFECLPALNQRWQAIIKEPLHLGIGINSGVAQVGNVGSRIKFKYGALGNTVNLASRVQGATKHLKTSLLITDTTRAALDHSFRVRRLCQVRVVNIAEPVTLFELVEPNKAGWDNLKAGYELALAEFSKAEFRQACRILGRLIPDHPTDGPALILLSRAVGFLVEKPEPFDPVMVLERK